MKKKIKYSLLILCFLFISVDCTAQIKKDTLKILFVGNSYTYYENMPKMVSDISDNASTKLITEMSIVGGARLHEHWLGNRGLKTKKIIRNGQFDIVVIQGHSTVAIKKPDTLRKYSKLFSDFIKESGAKPYFYLTWAREYDPEKQGEITKVYTEVAKENNATLVPVGLAWASARKQRKDIELYNLDGSHPSRLGAYLTANVFIATILNEVPKDTPNLSKNFVFLKKVAREFVKN